KHHFSKNGQVFFHIFWVVTLIMQSRQLRTKLILHSDPGWQYQMFDYQQRPKKIGIQPSMSRKGSCHDRAPIQGFSSTCSNVNASTDVALKLWLTCANSSRFARIGLTT
ncbi:hypothetical protein OIU45_14825, partial [Lacticaseibacillus paracasei]